MKKKVILVADDFGLSPEINAAILRAHVSGSLQAAALMLGQPGTEEAIALARAHPALQIGWHIHLNDSQPTTIPRWPWGRSPTRAGLSFSFSRSASELMHREISRQWELFQATGLPCHFVNSHHHLQAHPAVFAALTQTLGADFKGWIRLGRVRTFPPASRLFSTVPVIDLLFQRQRKLSSWPSPDTLWGLDRLFCMRAEEVRTALTLLPDGFHEFLFHPRDFSCPDTQCLLQLKMEGV